MTVPSVNDVDEDGVLVLSADMHMWECIFGSRVAAWNSPFCGHGLGYK